MSCEWQLALISMLQFASKSTTTTISAIYDEHETIVTADKCVKK